LPHPMLPMTDTLYMVVLYNLYNFYINIMTMLIMSNSIWINFCM